MLADMHDCTRELLQYILAKCLTPSLNLSVEVVGEIVLQQAMLQQAVLRQAMLQALLLR